MRPVDIVRKLAPHGRPEYLAAFDQGDDLFQKFEMTTPARLAPFLATILEETGDLAVTYENMNYTAPRIAEVWPSRPEAVKYAHDPVNLANCVYGSRMGNRGWMSGDGYRYRGTGLLQTTGLEAFQKYAKEWGVDFVGHPELLLTAEHALKPALSEWRDHGCNELADKGDFREITHRVNGGYTNMPERLRQLGRVKAAMGDGAFEFHKVLPSVTGAVVVAASAAKTAGIDVTLILQIGAGLSMAAFILWMVFRSKKQWLETSS